MFVIRKGIAALAVFVSCTSANQNVREAHRACGNAVHIATLESASVNESSGLAASRRQNGVFWTHNDSGSGPFIYAFARSGEHRGVWRITGANAIDWEDMAIGPGPLREVDYLYLGDIGDNRKSRDEIVVYRVAEPAVIAAARDSTVETALPTARADVLRLRYPDGKHDAETLLVHPVTADLYVITKSRGVPARIYKSAAHRWSGDVSALAYIGEVRFPNAFVGFITGGDISPDGRSVVLSDYLSACEFTLPAKGGSFDDVWHQPCRTIEIGDYRGVRKQGEAICYGPDGRALFATSEAVPAPLIEVVCE